MGVVIPGVDWNVHLTSAHNAKEGAIVCGSLARRRIRPALRNLPAIWPVGGIVQLAQRVARVDVIGRAALERLLQTGTCKHAAANAEEGDEEDVAAVNTHGSRIHSHQAPVPPQQQLHARHVSADGPVARLPRTVSSKQ